MRTAAIAQHQRALLATGGFFSEAITRIEICHDFTHCPHTSGVFIEVENDHGVWGVIVCVNCGQLQGGPECPHESSTWNEDGSLLTCDNCGIDGT